MRSLIIFLISILSFSIYAEPIIIKVGLIDPETHIDSVTAKKFADLVNEKAGDEVKIEVYPSAQLGLAPDMLQGMKLGSIEMFIGATTWLGSFDKDFWISGSLYAFDNQEKSRAFHQGEFFQSLSEKLTQKHKIRLLDVSWDRGGRNFISQKKIETPESLNGLKVRVPEQRSWILGFKLAGAAPTPIALSETFTSLQQGVIDSTEQASNWLYFNNYYTIAKYLTRSHHNYEQTGVMISERVYVKLSPKVKDVIQDSLQEVSKWHNDALIDDIKSAEDKMAESGVNIIEVNNDVWKDHFRKNFKKLVDEVGYSEEAYNAIISGWK